MRQFRAGAVEVGSWFLLHGLSVLGLKEILYWFMRLCDAVVGFEQPVGRDDPYLYLVALIGVFGVWHTLRPSRDRESRRAWADAVALGIIHYKIGREELGELIHPGDDKRHQELLPLRDRDELLREAGFRAWSWRQDDSARPSS